MAANNPPPANPGEAPEAAALAVPVPTCTPEVLMHIDEYVMGLKLNNPASYYMGRRRGKGVSVADDGHDILRVIPTLASVGMLEPTSGTVSGYAGYNLKNQGDIFNDHMKTLDTNEGKIATTGNFVSLTPEGEKFVKEHETDWLTIEVTPTKYKVFKKFCEENNVEHLLKFSHKAQTNLEVLQRWITFFSQGLKCEQAFRFLYATANIPITKERRNEVRRYFDLKRDWGRYFQCWLEPINRDSRDGFPTRLLNCLFPEGRDAPPAMWCMQPVFGNPKKPKPEDAQRNAAEAADEAAQRNAVEDPAPAALLPQVRKRRHSVRTKVRTKRLGFTD